MAVFAASRSVVASALISSRRTGSLRRRVELDRRSTDPSFQGRDVERGATLSPWPDVETQEPSLHGSKLVWAGALLTLLRWWRL
jgi:hypothetical protein